MPTADWREEKSEAVVKAICRLLASPATPPAIKEELASEVLWNALKLFADALQERLGSEKTKWSPGVVNIFREDPSRCEEWLELMSEPDFSADDYWKKK
jgi:hypothetical protein